MCCSCRTVLFKIGSAAVVEMKTWAMPTDGARPWESVGGCSPLLRLKAFVCPLSPQPAMQGSRLAAAAAQRLQPPACLSTAPRRANIGHSERSGESFKDAASAAGCPRPPRIRCASHPAALPLAPALGEGGSVADPGGAAEGPHRPATGRGFQHGQTTGWGAAPASQVESGSRDLLEVILSRNWQ